MSAEFLPDFEGGFVQVPLELLVAIKVAVGLLDDDMAFEQEPFDHLSNVEGGVMGIAGTECDVLQVEEDCHRCVRIMVVHMTKPVYYTHCRCPAGNVRKDDATKPGRI